MRKTEYDIMETILNRWSPRAFEPVNMEESDLLAMIDAARWAPSSYNNQPWRFIYALRETDEWNKLYDLLIDFNKSWAKNSSALLVIASKKNFDNGKPSFTHQFDTGAAWQNFSLEATKRGFFSHGMQGFDYEKARTVLNIPDEYEILAMSAIGKKADPETLPLELKEKEVMTDRKSIEEISFKGTM